MFLFELILYVTVIISQSCQNVAWVEPPGYMYLAEVLLKDPMKHKPELSHPQDNVK